MTPIKIGKSWRIKRSNGELFGWYLTKEQAEKAISRLQFLPPEEMP